MVKAGIKPVYSWHEEEGRTRRLIGKSTWLGFGFRFNSRRIHAMGTPISMGPDGLVVADDPIIPFIEGDGIGPDIWAAAVRVFDGAVDKA